MRAAAVPAPGQGGHYYQVAVLVVVNVHGVNAEDAQCYAADLLCRPSATSVRLLGAPSLQFKGAEELSDDELEAAALGQQLIDEGTLALQEEHAP